MDTASRERSQVDMGAAVRNARGIYAENFLVVLAVSLIALLPSSLAYVFLLDSWFFEFADLLYFTGIALIGAAVVRVVVDFEGDGGEVLSAFQVLGAVLPRLFPIAVLGILTNLLITVGLVFLIVPGVILTLMWVAAMPTLVVEGKGPFASMSRSGWLTMRRRSKLTAYAAIFIGGNLLIILLGWLAGTIDPVLDVAVSYLANAMFFPFISILAAEIYFRLIEADRQDAVRS